MPTGTCSAPSPSYHRNASGPLKEELAAIQMITDNVAQAITWSRNPRATQAPFDMLPRQIAALDAIVSAISNQAAALGPDGQAAVEAIAAGTDKLAAIVDRHMSAPVETQH